MAIAGRLGVLGGGNMGSALLQGLLAKGAVAPGQVVVAEMDQAKGRALAEKFGVAVVSAPAELGQLDILVVAVKPYDVPSALEAASPGLSPGSLVISLAAGVTLATLTAHLPVGQPVIRTMPNTPALVFMGATAMAPAPAADREDFLAAAQEIFEAVGRVVVVAEKHLDAVTGLSGSGPAYVFLFLEALADGGVAQGLDRGTARLLAAQTVAGAAKLALEDGRHTGELKDMVTSPGGTTIAGLRELEKGAFRGVVMEAVAAATARSREQGKG
ncbi:MAG: pyrroline-5-carboxylate reductase [Deltaproteobacteria bacterium]|nr:pyrroline-5-carboxylate reductase [Deltaproteobacteria bacterium]